MDNLQKWITYSLRSMDNWSPKSILVNKPISVIRMGSFLWLLLTLPENTKQHNLYAKIHYLKIIVKLYIDVFRGVTMKQTQRDVGKSELPILLNKFGHNMSPEEDE